MVLWSLPLLVRETTEDESQNNGAIGFGQEEETYNIAGGSMVTLGGLIFQHASFKQQPIAALSPRRVARGGYLVCFPGPSQHHGV